MISVQYRYQPVTVFGGSVIDCYRFWANATQRYLTVTDYLIQVLPFPTVGDRYLEIHTVIHRF